MSRYHVRCSNYKCKARQVLSKHPDEYKRPRRCWACGGSRWTIDAWKTKRNTRAMGCMCSGYNNERWAVGIMSGAMHRKGSKSCWYRADGTQRVPGDSDFYDENYEAYHVDEDCESIVHAGGDTGSISVVGDHNDQAGGCELPVSVEVFDETFS